MTRMKYSLFALITALALLGTQAPKAQAATLEDAANATMANEFQTVNKEMSSYLAERTPFFASLGRNAYRAALPGADLLPVSFMVSAGAGMGFMGDFDSIQQASSDVTSIGVDGMSSLPFLIGPSLYGRVSIPKIPVLGSFDFGFKYIQPIELSNDDLEYKNLGYGFDVRYAILRDIPIIPLIHLSLSAGYAYDQLNGEFKTKGEIKGGGYTIDGKFGPEWNVQSHKFFARATGEIAILSVTVGAGYLMHGGDVTSSLEGSVSGTTFDPVKTTTDADGSDVTLMGGVGLSFIPFTTLYFEYNYNTTTEDTAITGAFNFVF